MSDAIEDWTAASELDLQSVISMAKQGMKIAITNSTRVLARIDNLNVHDWVSSMRVKVSTICSPDHLPHTAILSF